MSFYATQPAAGFAPSPGDADLLVRVGIALALRQRAGWRAVRIGAQNGVVQLAGIVPTFYDRQLIASVASHVAGVFRVADELKVANAEVSKPAAETEVAANRGPKTNSGPWRNKFSDIPVLTESLEDILAKHEASTAKD